VRPVRWPSVACSRYLRVPRHRDHGDRRILTTKIAVVITWVAMVTAGPTHDRGPRQIRCLRIILGPQRRRERRQSADLAST